MSFFFSNNDSERWGIQAWVSCSVGGTDIYFGCTSGNSGTTITYKQRIDWGDGGGGTLHSVNTPASYAHTYSTPGIYRVKWNRWRADEYRHPLGSFPTEYTTPHQWTLGKIANNDNVMISGTLDLRVIGPWKKSPLDTTNRSRFFEIGGSEAIKNIIFPTDCIISASATTPETTTTIQLPRVNAGGFSMSGSLLDLSPMKHISGKWVSDTDSLQNLQVTWPYSQSHAPAGLWLDWAGSTFGDGTTLDLSGCNNLGGFTAGVPTTCTSILLPTSQSYKPFNFVKWYLTTNAATYKLSAVGPSGSSYAVSGSGVFDISLFQFKWTNTANEFYMLRNPFMKTIFIPPSGSFQTGTDSNIGFPFLVYSDAENNSTVDAIGLSGSTTVGTHDFSNWVLRKQFQAGGSGMTTFIQPDNVYMDNMANSIILAESGCTSIDISNLTNSYPSSTIWDWIMYGHSSLTSIILPTMSFDGAMTRRWDQLNLYNCALSTCSFWPFSGSADSSNRPPFAKFDLDNNGMTAAEVNRILVDLDDIGWYTGSIEIAGSNAAPDGTSGGLDGSTAVTNLTNKNWTVVTS